jgi:predicted Zn-dependent protease
MLPLLALLSLAACATTAGRSVRPSRPLGFPATCAHEGRRLVVVPLGEVAAADLERLAARYRRAYGLEVTVSPALPLPPQAYDPARRQWFGELLLDTLDRERPATADTALVLGVLPHDLYLQSMPWRFALSAFHSRTAVVSTARLDPVFFHEAPDPERRDERLYKLVTRLLGSALCELPRRGSERSVMRETILSLEDLDGIDESRWD